MSLDIQSLPHKLIGERKELPHVSAIYFVVEDEVLLYIGLTIDIKNRWSGHHRLNDFSDVAKIYWLETNAQDLAAREVEFITEFSPELNANPGGAGRPKGAKNKLPLKPGCHTSVHFTAKELEIVEMAKQKYPDMSLSKIICHALRCWIKQGAPLQD